MFCESGPSRALSSSLALTKPQINSPTELSNVTERGEKGERANSSCPSAPTGANENLRKGMVVNDRPMYDDLTHVKDAGHVQVEESRGFTKKLGSIRATSTEATNSNSALTQIVRYSEK